MSRELLLSMSILALAAAVTFHAIAPARAAEPTPSGNTICTYELSGGAGTTKHGDSVAAWINAQNAAGRHNITFQTWGTQGNYVVACAW